MPPSPTLLLLEGTTPPAWEPFAATRPLAGIPWGSSTLGERVARASGHPAAGVVTAPRLAGFDEPGSLPAREAPSSAGPEGLLLWATLAAPTGPIPVAEDGEAVSYRVDGRLAGYFLPPHTSLDPDLLDRISRGAEHRSGTAVVVPGRWIEAPWTLVATHPDRLGVELIELGAEGPPRGYVRLRDGRGVHAEGRHPVWAATGVEVDPGVTFDTREGPILLERGVRVQGPARLIGPLHIGRETLLLGGPIGRSTIGPVCKLRGEVSDSVFLGWTNKAHNGHMGHALVGRWVNLGAATINSDLRNDYGEVRLRLAPAPAPQLPTGLTKVGSFLGDHVKTGIGTLLTTGAVIGAGSQVAVGGLTPTPLPPFSWVTPSGCSPYRLDRFEETVRTVMARRDLEPTPGVSEVLRRLHRTTHPTG